MTSYYIGSALLIGVTVWVEIGALRHAKRLRNLRSNCFLTNEKGHRVRYADASAAVRAKAEGVD